MTPCTPTLPHQLADMNKRVADTRRRFYLVTVFMLNDKQAQQITHALDAKDLDQAQLIYERATGLTGP